MRICAVIIMIVIEQCTDLDRALWEILTALQSMYYS